jgi:hypothetical protein
MRGTGNIVNGSDLDQIKVVDIGITPTWGTSVLDRGILNRGSGDISTDGFNGDPNDDVHFGRSSDTVNNYKTLMHYILRSIVTFLRRLDTESVTTFQSMYYMVFTVAAAAMVAMPDMHAYYVSVALGRYYYDMWLIATLVCPSLTLFGRWLTTRAAHTPPGKPNGAVGAAWLQLSGDLGVWGTVLVYVASMMATAWWTKELYTFGFMVMGIAGGGMFTLRSARRIHQINQRSRRESWKT